MVRLKFSGNVEHPFIAITPRCSKTQGYKTISAETLVSEFGECEVSFNYYFSLIHADSECWNLSGLGFASNGNIFIFFYIWNHLTVGKQMTDCLFELLVLRSNSWNDLIEQMNE